MPVHDYHMHSNYSCDCRATMAQMCRSSIEHGISEIGFTEHYDLKEGEECRDWFRLEPWAEELNHCRQQFADRLIIRASIELGEPHLYRRETQTMLARYDFDYALGSLHWVGAQCIFDRRYFTGRTPDNAYSDYFAELERMTDVGGFDVLSHFDVVTRVGFAEYGEYDPTRYETIIRRVLQNCIRHGIALDINTKGLRSGRVAGEKYQSALLSPGLQILRWYADMGGERITLGSDAHRPENIGADFAPAIQAAQAAGLRHLTFYNKRQATLVPFEQIAFTF